jgi:predicted transcriptional regulator
MNWSEMLKTLLSENNISPEDFINKYEGLAISAIYNILNNPTIKPRKSTKGIFERAFNIKIDDSDITDIKWKKNTPIEAVQPTSTAITNEQQLIAKIQQLEDENKQLKSTLATLQAVFNTLTH